MGPGIDTSPDILEKHKNGKNNHQPWIRAAVCLLSVYDCSPCVCADQPENGSGRAGRYSVVSGGKVNCKAEKVAADPADQVQDQVADFSRDQPQ